METTSEMQEEEKPSLPFIASLDPSNPLGLLEKVLDFIGKESEFLLKDTAEKEISAAVTATRKRLREAEKEEKEESLPIESEKPNKESLEPTEHGKENVTHGEVPNKGNGLDFEMYSWTQNLKEVTITIPVPSGINPRCFTCEFKQNRLKVRLNYTIIEGALFDAVKPEDCFCYVYDEKVITVLLTKVNKYQWWKYCVKGEPEIDTKKIDPKSSKLDDLDPETRSKVEKMLFDEREKHEHAKKVKPQGLSLLELKQRRFRNNLTAKRN